MSETLEQLSNDQDASFLSFMPGQRLRKARELRGLSREDVARDLHLSLRFVKAIEDDNYAELPEPAFVRGYMRRYAQLVRLSPDDIAAKFDQSLTVSAEQVDTRTENPVRLLGDFAKRPRLPVKALLSLASVALIVLMAVGTFLWSSNQTEHAVVVPEQPLPVDEPAPAPAPAPAGQPLSLEPVAPVPAGPVADTVVAPVAPVPAAPVAGQALPLAPQPEVASAVSAPVVQQPVQVASSAVLEFAVSADSWIRVTDADGKALAGALKHRGESLAVSGKPPFSIHIGYAKGVVLTANGKPVDLTPHVTGNVASFKLNP